MVLAPTMARKHLLASQKHELHRSRVRITHISYPIARQVTC